METSAGGSTILSGFRLGKRPALDGLRGIAVLGVFLNHLGVSTFRLGFLGVDLFFVLNGFLITALMIEETNRSGGVRLTAFFARRGRRLLPGFLLFAVVAFVTLSPFLEAAKGRELAIGLVTSVFYFRNWHQIVTQTGLDGYAMPHLWSLAVEEQFYLLWPFVFGWIVKRIRGSRLAALLVVLIAASTVTSMWLHHSGVSASRIILATDTRSAQLLVGALLAVVVCEGLIKVKIPTGRGALDLALIATLGLLLTMGGLLNSKTFLDRFYLRGGMTVFAGGVALLILLGLQRPQSLGTRLLSLRPLRFMGSISYAFYLWHQLILEWVGFPGSSLQYGLLAGRGVGVRAVVSLTLSIVVAWLSTRYFEKRLMSWFSWADERHSNQADLSTVSPESFSPPGNSRFSSAS